MDKARALGLTPNKVVLPPPVQYEVIQLNNGDWIGRGGAVEMIVRAGIVYKRRSIKKGLINGETAWLVGELDGVKLYVSEVNGMTRLVLTREDINP